MEPIRDFLSVFFVFCWVIERLDGTMKRKWKLFFLSLAQILVCELASRADKSQLSLVLHVRIQFAKCSSVNKTTAQNERAICFQLKLLAHVIAYVKEKNDSSGKITFACFSCVVSIHLQMLNWTLIFLYHNQHRVIFFLFDCEQVERWNQRKAFEC